MTFLLASRSGTGLFASKRAGEPKSTEARNWLAQNRKLTTSETAVPDLPWRTMLLHADALCKDAPPA